MRNALLGDRQIHSIIVDLRWSLLNWIGLIGSVWISSADFSHFTSTGIAVELGVAISVSRDLLNRRLFLDSGRWLSSFLCNISPLTLIQILQVFLNLLLLNQVKPCHFIFSPCLPSLSFSDLLLKLSLVVILPALLNLAFIEGLIRYNNLSWLRRSHRDNVPTPVSIGRSRPALAKSIEKIIGGQLIVQLVDIVVAVWRAVNVARWPFLQGLLLGNIVSLLLLLILLLLSSVRCWAASSFDDGHTAASAAGVRVFIRVLQCLLLLLVSSLQSLWA